MGKVKFKNIWKLKLEIRELQVNTNEMIKTIEDLKTKIATMLINQNKLLDFCGIDNWQEEMRKRLSMGWVAKIEPVVIECEFYNPEYCTPCKSPDKIYECDLVKIGNQIKLYKWKPE